MTGAELDEIWRTEVENSTAPARIAKLEEEYQNLIRQTEEILESLRSWAAGSGY